MTFKLPRKRRRIGITHRLRNLGDCAIRLLQELYACQAYALVGGDPGARRLSIGFGEGASEVVFR